MDARLSPLPALTSRHAAYALTIRRQKAQYYPSLFDRARSPQPFYAVDARTCAHFRYAASSVWETLDKPAHRLQFGTALPDASDYEFATSGMQDIPPHQQAVARAVLDCLQNSKYHQQTSGNPVYVVVHVPSDQTGRGTGWQNATLGGQILT